MNRNEIKRVQAMSHRESPAKTMLKNEFISNLKAKLGERKYRADLNFMTAAKNTTSSFKAEIAYNTELGHPSENDILTLVAQNYPTHEIDWDLIQVDSDEGIVSLMLEPSVEVVPVTSVKSIPPEFVAIGTGIYKRAVDQTGNVQEIWTLKKNDGGLALYRSPNDLEITAEEEGFKAGDVVELEEFGPGRIKRFDENGNAFVQVGNRLHIVAQMDLQQYSVDKEKTKLEKYYSELYGPEFSKGMVQDFSTNKK